MFCSSKLKTTQRGGESPPSKTPAVPPGASGVDQALADKFIKISVRGAPHQTHTLHLKLSDTVADLNVAVEELGYDLSVDRLCHLGGPSLPQDDHVTLAESGLRANSSLQVLGRLRGGAEVSLFGRQHSLGDTGLLDLKGQDVGPGKLNEVAAFLASPESAGVRRLVLSGNMITDRGKDLFGLKELCQVLPTLKHSISLDLSNCGLGVAEVNEVAAAIHAGAALNSLKCAHNLGMVGELDEDGDLKTPDAHAEVFKELTDSLKASLVTEADFSSCGIGPVALGHLGEWVREARAAVNSVTLDSTGDTKSWNGDWNNGGPKTYTLTVGEEEIDLSNMNLGSSDVALVDSWLQRPEVSAAVTEVTLAGNFVGTPMIASATQHSVKKGCFIMFNGRAAEVFADPDSSDQHMLKNMKWVDDGHKAWNDGNYIKASEVSACATSVSDLAEDYSHIEQLGQAATRLTKVDLANCKFNPVSLATFVESVRWADAALTTLKCTNNPGMVGKLDDEYGSLQTPDAHAEVFKQLTDGLKTSQVTEADFSSCGIGPIALGNLSDWVREATAAVARLSLAENHLIRGRKVQSREEADEYGDYMPD